MKTNPKKTLKRRGFALIVTLSLMILLTVVAVGLLSLSSISLRSASQASAANIARNNARLAMMLALGELQTSMGTDTSVSAPASSVISGASRSQLVGAWKRPVPVTPTDSGKWHWTPVASGAPVYTDKADPQIFKGWLVSTDKPSDSTVLTLPGSAIVAGTNIVTLVGNVAKPLTNNGVSTVVNAAKVKVGSGSQLGKFAWYVSDESTKAPIQLGDGKKQTPGEETASRSASRRVRADILATQLKPSLADPQNLISLETAIIPGGTTTTDEIRKRFHDFTTSSMGLLTDTANGGLKVDLTPIFEDNSLTMPAGAFTAPAATTPYPSTQFGAAAGAPKWTYLKDLYRKYKGIVPSGGELVYTPVATTDLKINTTGLNTSPDNERLIPIIAKFQVAFSIVSHYAHITVRKNWHRDYSPEKNNEAYAVPHLAYDPVITLYNPYDVAIDMNRLRIRMWDPPVGFRFKKIDKQKGTSVYFRPGGAFEGLAKFTSTEETNANARRAFTLILTDGTSAAAGAKLKLMPGEVKVFSARVEDNWNWALECADEWNPRAFFDWGRDRNFGNTDNRNKATPTATGNFGLESVPGWQYRAGLQTDHLAYGGRSDESKYDFEKTVASTPYKDKGVIGGFVSMRLTDEVQVEAEPLVTKAGGANSFQVDILAGITAGDVRATSNFTDATNSAVSQDTLRSFKFNFANATDPSAELSATPGSPIILRKYTVADTLQKLVEPTIPGSNVEGPGLKKPFAMLEMSARATKDPLTDSKPWLYNNPIVEGATQTSSTVGLTNQSYDLRFTEMTGFTGFPGGIDIDPDSYRGYFGAQSSRNTGSSFVHMMHVSAAPMASLGELIHSNLISSSQLPRVVHPFGNSRAHPLIPTTTISKSLGGLMLDHSYLLNDALWDKYYFSSVADYSAGIGAMDQSMSRKDVLTGIFDGTKPAYNSRLVPVKTAGDVKSVVNDVNGLGTVPFSRQLAKYLAVSGPFNLSSTSVDAWRSVLSSLRDRSINGGQIAGSGTAWSVSNHAFTNGDLTPFVRSGRPLADSTAVNSIRWAGYRALTDTQITALAKSIVTEITKRGAEDKAPAFSVGEFVNRRLGSSTSMHTLAGLLQTAIDNTDINNNSRTLDGNQISASSIVAARKKNAVTTEVMDGNSSEGAPSMLTQGDLMNALAPIATVRGDTFKIRSYGEATSTTGAAVLARAWCEVIVQRVPEFVDPADSPETEIASLTSNANMKFGRRFNIVSFRWLNEGEL